MRPTPDVPDVSARRDSVDTTHTARHAPAGCSTSATGSPEAPGLAEAAESQLERLSVALGWSGLTPEARELLRAVTATWTRRPLSDGPRFSAVSEDGSPYEVSLAFTPGRAELRVLVEAQAEPATPARYWDAGRALNDFLARRLKVGLTPLEDVLDLFVPRGPRMFCAVWHGLRFTPGRDPDVRLYLDPHARGPGSAPAVTAEVLERLGLGAARGAVDAVLSGGRLGLGLLALDLGASPRVKLYFSAPRLTADEVETTAAHAVDAVPGEARDFYRQVLGGDGPHDGQPLRVCFTVDGAHGGRLSRPVTDIPVGSSMDDATAAGRAREALRRHGLDVAAYERCVQVMGPGPVGNGHGLHPVLSFQRDRGEPRVTVYLAPRLYQRGGHVTEALKQRLWRDWSQMQSR